jgi:hypothetical protein
MSSKILFEYQGKGKIAFDDGVEVESEVIISAKQDGSATLTGMAHLTPELLEIMKSHSEQKWVHAKFSGQEDQTKSKISINDLYLKVIDLSSREDEIVRISFVFIIGSEIKVEYSSLELQDSVRVEFKLTNFLFNGCDWSEIGDYRVLDKFQAKIGEVFTFKQNPDYNAIAKSLKDNRGILVSSHALVETTFQRIQEIDQHLQDALTLLSFATGSYISAVSRNIYKDNVLCQTYFTPCRTSACNPSEPVVRNHEQCDLKTFIEKAFSNYASLNNELGLDKVVDYYLQAKLEKTLQIKYLLCAVAFECLTSYLLEYFKNQSKKADLSSFKNRMESLCAEFNVTYDPSELKFIDVRDKIVHTGDFSAGMDGWEELTNLMNFLDRVILTIVGYKGNHYLNRAKGYSYEVLE